MLKIVVEAEALGEFPDIVKNNTVLHMAALAAAVLCKVQCQGEKDETGSTTLKKINLEYSKYLLDNLSKFV